MKVLCPNVSFFGLSGKSSCKMVVIGAKQILCGHEALRREKLRMNLKMCQ